jgi:hypothetical protein
VPGVEPLDFGIGFHAGLEIYYDPERWEQPRTVVEAESLGGFMTHMMGWKKRLQKVNQWAAQSERWNELVTLGQGMYEHYFEWAPEADKLAGWTPIKSEIEFEVPIMLPVQPGNGKAWDRIDASQNLSLASNGQLLLWVPELGQYAKVVYQGRIDLIVKDAQGRYWIVDHKTAAQFGQTEHLELDQQCGSYTWALVKMMGIQVAGVIYNEIRKKVPNEPTVLKNGGLSQNKNQGTTVIKYRKELIRRGLDPADYSDFLERLAENQQEYFRRNMVFRGSRELAKLEQNIILEAVDMLDDPLIYPNPDRWNCNGCQFRSPCLMVQDGSDWEWHMRESGVYMKRKDLAVLVESKDEPKQEEERAF